MLKQTWFWLLTLVRGSNEPVRASCCLSVLGECSSLLALAAPRWLRCCLSPGAVGPAVPQPPWERDAQPLAAGTDGQDGAGVWCALDWFGVRAALCVRPGRNTPEGTAMVPMSPGHPQISEDEMLSQYKSVVPVGDAVTSQPFLAFKSSAGDAAFPASKQTCCFCMMAYFACGASRYRISTSKPPSSPLHPR